MVKISANEKVILEVLNSCNRHIVKYGFRTRNIKDLKKVIEG